MISTSVVRSTSPALYEQQSISSIGLALFAVCALAGAVAAAVIDSRVPLIAALLAGVYLLFSIKVASQWQRVASYAGAVTAA
jgi:hypothetical protein